MPTEQTDAGEPARDSAYFDGWYSEMEVSAVKDAILTRHLGVPEDYAGATGVLTWNALDEIGLELRLPTGGDGVLADIACGRGGYGIELARRCGARLYGVDISAVALRRAELTAARHGQQAEFRVGTLNATGLGSNSTDALLCTDSVQFAEPPSAALAEFRRVLRSGGRLALTTWQPIRPKALVPERLRALDLRGGLENLGFTEIAVLRRARWRWAERAVFEAAVAAPNDGQDLALASLQREARGSLEHFDDLQRIVVYATAP